MAKRLILLLILFVVGDIYFYQAISMLAHGTIIPAIYWLLDVGLFFALFALLLMRRRGTALQKFIPSFMSALILSFVPKISGSIVLLGEDISRLFRGFPARNVYVSEAAMAVAALVFLIIIFGLTRGKHFYRVRRETLYFPDLPEVFDGFTITQLSDIHSGSLRNGKAVRRGIALANAQDSDMLLFTGDLVNNMASEMDPWIDNFTQLKARYGKYSVLGNHDYGDYMQWPSAAAKTANLNRLKDIHAEMGFKLLLNETVEIHKKGKHIALIGVENWGKGGFHKYGDLQLASRDLTTDSFKILMSHDPSHWEEVTLKHAQHIHLTVAGHTHGMQFGIELFGFKWSPIQYFYKQWAGIYDKEGKYLYVNRGFGFHGLRGRVGVWPEITVLTLRRAADSVHGQVKRS